VKRYLLFLAIAVTLVTNPKSQPQTSSPSLRKIIEFDLPGPLGKRFDYLTIDPDDHYLISAHLAAGQTYVVGLRTNKVVATVADTPGAEGVEYVSELKKFYTSNAGDNTIGVVDLPQMKVVKKLSTDHYPTDTRGQETFNCVREFCLPRRFTKRAAKHTEPEAGKTISIKVWNI